MTSVAGDIPQWHASRIFRDEAGQPQFIDCSVVYCDVLGTSAATNNLAIAIATLKKLLPALAEARERSNTAQTTSMRAVSWFTDNFVAAAPVHDRNDVEVALGMTAVDIAYSNLILLEAGFLIRGGIAFGAHYADPDYVFGPALVEAVSIESQTRYPRVALSDHAVEMTKAIVRDRYGPGGDYPHSTSLAVDASGTVFVNELGVWLSEEDDFEVAKYRLPRLKASIETGLSEATGYAAYEKWKWRADFHNFALQRASFPFETELVACDSPHHSFADFDAFA